jgi:ribosomal protein S8E
VNVDVRALEYRSEIKVQAGRSERGYHPCRLSGKQRQMARAKRKTKAGRQCAAPAVRGSVLCALYSDPNRAAELGRKGGARNRKVYDNDSCNVYVPESVQDVSCLRS